jgi:hypothetical protein
LVESGSRYSIDGIGGSIVADRAKNLRLDELLKRPGGQITAMVTIAIDAQAS